METSKLNEKSRKSSTFWNCRIKSWKYRLTVPYIKIQYTNNCVRPITIGFFLIRNKKICGCFSKKHSQFHVYLKGCTSKSCCEFQNKNRPENFSTCETYKQLRFLFHSFDYHCLYGFDEETIVTPYSICISFEKFSYIQNL